MDEYDGPKDSHGSGRFGKSMRSRRIKKNKADLGKLDTKRHIVVDQNGVPLALFVLGANVKDSEEATLAYSSQSNSA